MDLRVNIGSIFEFLKILMDGRKWFEIIQSLLTEKINKLTSVLLISKIFSKMVVSDLHPKYFKYLPKTWPVRFPLSSG